MINDPRTQEQALASLLDPVMPKTPYEQAREKYGTGGTLMRILGTGLSGGLLGDMLIPETGPQNQDRYENDMALYNAYKAKLLDAQIENASSAMERGRMGDLHETLRAAWQTPDVQDDIEAGMAAIAGGMSLDDLKFFQKQAGLSVGDEKWEKVEINGDYYYQDANNPEAPPIPVKMDDGTIAAKAVDADTRKTSGWFRRAVPALENLHKLEDRGVTVSRDALLLMKSAQNANGFFDKAVYDKLLNKLNLSKEQKQYLRNAQDLAMIQLRKESGAAIGVEEMFNELAQIVMLDDMSDEGYTYQRGARSNKFRGLADGLNESVIRGFKEDKLFERMDTLRSNSSRYTGPYDYTGVSDSDFEEIYERMPDGTRFIGPDGKEYVKGSAQ